MARRDSKGRFLKKKKGRKKTMARRRRSSSAGRTTIVRAPAPIVKVTAPRAPKHHRRRRSGAGFIGGVRSHEHLLISALGGAALGWLEREKVPLPSFGPLGPAATTALITWAIGKYGRIPLATHASTGMVAVSAYKWGAGQTASLMNLGGGVGAILDDE